MTPLQRLLTSLSATALLAGGAGVAGTKYLAPATITIVQEVADPQCQALRARLTAQTHAPLSQLPDPQGGWPGTLKQTPTPSDRY